MTYMGLRSKALTVAVLQILVQQFSVPPPKTKETETKPQLTPSPLPSPSAASLPLSLSHSVPFIEYYIAKPNLAILLLQLLYEKLLWTFLALCSKGSIYRWYNLTQGRKPCRVEVSIAYYKRQNIKYLLLVTTRMASGQKHRTSLKKNWKNQLYLL